MALVIDKGYLLHSLRLSHLRATDDPHSPRLISLSPSTLSTNPYVRATGLSDIDSWPEISRGLDSPPLRAEEFDQDEFDEASGYLLDGSGVGSSGGGNDGRRRRRRRFNGIGVDPDEPSRRYAPMLNLNKNGAVGSSTDVDKDRDNNGTSHGQTGTGIDSQQRDPSVTLKYSATIGKPSILAPGMRISQKLITDLPGASVPSRSDSGGGLTSSATPTPTATTGLGGLRNFGTRRSKTVDELEEELNSNMSSPRKNGTGILRDRTRSSTMSESIPPSTSPTFVVSSERTPTTRTLSGLGAGAANGKPNGMQTPPPTSPLSEDGPPHSSQSKKFPTLSTLRQNRPRADSAPVLVVTSPGVTSAITNQLSPRRNNGSIAGPGAVAGVFPNAATQAQAAALHSPSLHAASMVGSAYGYGGDPRTGGFGSILEQTMSQSQSGTGTSFDGDDDLGGRLGGIGGIEEEDGEDDAEAEFYHDAEGETMDGDNENDGGVEGSMVELGESLGISGGGGSSGLGGVGAASDEEEEGDEGMGLGTGLAGRGVRSGLGVQNGAARKGNLGPRGQRAGSGASKDSRETGVKFETRLIQAPATTEAKPSVLTLLFNPPANQAQANGSLSHGPTSNPFFSSYSSVPPPTNSTIASISLDIYFPHSKSPSKPLKITVRTDVTVEEVIGWGLAKYWDDKERRPRLDDGLTADDVGDDKQKETQRMIRLSTVGWALRMVEDDGEIDDDFPALDRESQVSKFSFDAFAIVEATPSQIRQNVAIQPLRPLAVPVSTTNSRAASISGAATGPGSTLSMTRSGSNSSFDSSAVGGIMPGGRSGALSSAAGTGVMVLLRVNVNTGVDVKYSTTISVASDVYFADLIQLLITKKRLVPSNPEEWVLCLADASLALPLDRTVESLVGATNLALVTRTWAEAHRLIAPGRAGIMRGGDPNTSIFKRVSQPPRENLASQLTANYKRYLVQRKMPIGRHERILAIDGDYIHIMPSDQKGLFDSLKTSSFHVTSILSCKQSSKTPAAFRIVVWREGGAEKRYEFEASNARESNEIMTTIKGLLKLYESERRFALPAPKSRRL